MGDSGAEVLAEHLKCVPELRELKLSNIRYIYIIRI